MLRKVMCFLLCVLCCSWSTQVFAVDWCAGYNSPGNSYGNCDHTKNPDWRGNCVWWAAKERSDLNFLHKGRERHGKQWIWYAEQYGFYVNDEPVAGSVAVFEDMSRWGHVAYVTSVDSNNSEFDVTEMGYNDFDGMRENTYAISEASGFIYPTRTILYSRHQINGALMLMREDGEIVEDCNDTDRAALYSVRKVKRGGKKKNVVKYWDTYEGDYAIKLCEQATQTWGFYDINFAKFRQGKTVGTGLGGAYPDEGYVDPWERGWYKHRVSMKYLKGSVHERDRYKRKLNFVYGQTSPIDLKAKVRNKYSRTIKDVEVRFYYSPNKWFSTEHDELLGTEKISKIKGRKSKKRYLENIDISHLEIGYHYYFIDIVYPGGHNISNRKDKTERVVVRIIPPPAESVQTVEESEADGSFPVYEVHEGGYYTRQTLNPADPDNAKIIGYGFAEPQPGTVPVHEFDTGKQYFYTSTGWEFDYVYTDKGWDYKGPAYHAYPAESLEGEPVWRLWHYDSKTHDWTADLSLKNYWETSGSHRVDGTAWRILDPQ